MKELKQWFSKPITRGWYLVAFVVSIIVMAIAGMTYWIIYFTEIPERIKTDFKFIIRKIFRKRIQVHKNIQEGDL